MHTVEEANGEFQLNGTVLYRGARIKANLEFGEIEGTFEISPTGQPWLVAGAGSKRPGKYDLSDRLLVRI